MEVYRWAWSQGVQVAKDTGCKYWPSATSGYDGAAWDTPESRAGFSHVPTPEQFTAHIREAKKFTSDNYEWTDAQLLIYSMDEFGEQVTPLEPTVRNGDAYLRALKDAA
jgi:hypothetical protein